MYNENASAWAHGRRRADKRQAAACVVCVWHQLWPAQAAACLSGLDTSMHSLVGGALGLLLVFRTNSAYDRSPSPHPLSPPPDRTTACRLDCMPLSPRAHATGFRVPCLACPLLRHHLLTRRVASTRLALPLTAGPACGVERRFWEARKIWSSMIASIRDFSRLAHSSLSGWDREHTLQLLAVSLPPDRPFPRSFAFSLSLPSPLFRSGRHAEWQET